MITKGIRISQLVERKDLNGKEIIPFQDGTHNGKLSIQSLIDYIGDISDSDVELQALIKIQKFVDTVSEMDLLLYQAKEGDIYYCKENKKLYVRSFNKWDMLDPLTSKVYVLVGLDEYNRTNIIHLWNGNDMVVMSERLFLGETTGTAYDGGKGKALADKVQEFIDSKGAPNGLASLNESGIIPSAQLPSYVDVVIEVDTFSNLPSTGESGKIYIVQDTNLTYRWSGTGYVEISKSLALGETSSTAYPGDKGKATTDKLNKTSDKVVVGPTTVNPSTDKIVLKYQTHFTSTNSDSEDSHTINAATTSQAGVMSSADKTKLNGLKDQAGITSDINAVQTNLETHINNKSNPHEVTKDQVGLGNVDNTSDANKPISNATQTALNGKFSATDGNALKQRVDNIPELVATDITVDSDNDSVNISLDMTSIVDGTLSGTTININSATASKAGILVPTDKSKIDKIITNGNGTKYLSDNGTYKSGEQYYKINNDKFLPYLRTPAYYKDTDAETAITYVFNTVDKFKEFIDNALDNGYVLELINRTNNEKMYIRDYHVYRSSNGNYELSFIFIYSENNGSDNFALVTTRVFMSYNASNGYKFIVNNLVQSDNLTTVTKKTKSEYDGISAKDNSTMYAVTE